jgi:hypothetical protein
MLPFISRISKIFSYLTYLSVLNILIFPEVEAHGRLTIPQPRIKVSSGGINAPSYTCLGPAFQSSTTSMRCHDATSSSPLTTYNAGDTINLEWVMEAPHPGDCSIWLSYDTNLNSPQNWIKLKNIPGCLSPNGMDTPSGRNTYSFVLSENLPPCVHCVLRWEWYAVQQVSNVEFYVNCADIKIVNNIKTNCDKPGPTTTINGIEHLMYNLEDPTQKGCPFYNVYDANIRPPLDNRSRGPKEWTPVCKTGGVSPTTSQPTNQVTNQPTSPLTSQMTTPIPSTMIYPCSNINCGNFGTCSGGKCLCKNSYTGTNCEIPPKIQCNRNCRVLNRNTCETDNICGTCKSGFFSSVGYANEYANTLCSIECQKDCQKLNRRGCTEPNICGVCLSGFMEPNLKNKKGSCVKTAGNPDTGISLGITAQWENGFCANWVTTCPVNREITFNVPIELRDIRGWNLHNMQKINNRIIGNCAEWVSTGGKAYGGFCAAFDTGRVVKAGLKEFYFINRSQRLLNQMYKNPNILENLYKNVSITININENEYINYESFMDTLSMYLYGTEVKILNVKSNESNITEISLKILCQSRIDFDNALFLHLNKIESCVINENLFFKEPIITENENENESENQNNSSSLKASNLLLLFICSILIINFI